MITAVVTFKLPPDMTREKWREHKKWGATNVALADQARKFKHCCGKIVLH
jgi:hypothetical protein